MLPLARVMALHALRSYSSMEKGLVPNWVLLLLCSIIWASSLAVIFRTLCYVKGPFYNIFQFPDVARPAIGL